MSDENKVLEEKLKNLSGSSNFSNFKKEELLKHLEKFNIEDVDGFNRLVDLLTAKKEGNITTTPTPSLNKNINLGQSDTASSEYHKLLDIIKKQDELFKNQEERLSAFEARETQREVADDVLRFIGDNRDDYPASIQSNRALKNIANAYLDEISKDKENRRSLKEIADKVETEELEAYQRLKNFEEQNPGKFSLDNIKKLKELKNSTENQEYKEQTAKEEPTQTPKNTERETPTQALTPNQINKANESALNNKKNSAFASDLKKEKIDDIDKIEELVVKHNLRTGETKTSEN